jgi:hypothetical protein
MVHSAYSRALQKSYSVGLWAVAVALAVFCAQQHFGRLVSN